MNERLQAELSNVPPGTILAAGGIVRGHGENEGKIALVKRRRYSGEIGLPKGKVEPHEEIAATALREVAEETGYQAEIIAYAGRTRYMVKRHQKLVFYFIMRATGVLPADTRDVGEIETVLWMTPVEARLQLTHAEDRSLIASIFYLRGG
jgi:8-oxo-dGTP pyrophosphatase MutT (NUDIX family)